MPKEKKAFGKGRSPAKFSFTYEDIAQARGCSTEAARKHAQRGSFDPHDLMSVLEFINVKLGRKETELGEIVAEARVAVDQKAE